MANDRIVFRVHAIERMFQRRITVQDVRQVLAHGETIEEYPADFPYPSRLMLGWIGQRPIHVVAAGSESAGETIVITLYEPDPARWDADFRRREP